MNFKDVEIPITLLRYKTLSAYMLKQFCQVQYVELPLRGGVRAGLCLSPSQRERGQDGEGLRTAVEPAGRSSEQPQGR